MSQGPSDPGSLPAPIPQNIAAVVCNLKVAAIGGSPDEPPGEMLLQVFENAQTGGVTAVAIPLAQAATLLNVLGQGLRKPAAEAPRVLAPPSRLLLPPGAKAH